MLDWYDKNSRVLPWRAVFGHQPNPYYVWLSEMMLQQTTVVTVIPYFESFIQKWPTLESLALASLDEVLHAWQGLGYYARARNLYQCAQVVMGHYEGMMPEKEEDLARLPGIGPYTSAAIRSIAFNQPIVPIDGNIRRILSRVGNIKLPWPQSRSHVDSLAKALSKPDRPGDFAQALMDLGATVCKPKIPTCGDCPIQQYCLGYASGDPHKLPLLPLKVAKPKKYGIAFVIFNSKDQIFLEKRPEQGLLGGLMGVPTTDWTLNAQDSDDFPYKGDEKFFFQERVNHTFTHFHLELRVMMGRVRQSSPGKGIWVSWKELHRYPLPTLMKKVLTIVQKHLAMPHPSGLQQLV